MWEQFMGTGNYTIVQGIGDIIFVSITGALVVILFLSPFLLMIVIAKGLRSIGWNS